MIDSTFLSGVEKKWRGQRQQCSENQGKAWCRISYYGQDYHKLRHGRDLARQLFVIPKGQTVAGAKTTNSYADQVKGEDIVIHMRFNENLERDQKSKAADVTRDVRLNYFTSALDALGKAASEELASKRVGRVFLLTEPKFQQSAAVKTLMAHTGPYAYTQDKFTLVTGQIAEADIQLIAAAESFAFIGSFGTFSWIGAYLNANAKLIILPVFSDKPSPGWVHWCDLMIDDDERVKVLDLNALPPPATTGEAEAGAGNGATSREVPDLVDATTLKTGGPGGQWPMWKECLTERARDMWHPDGRGNCYQRDVGRGLGTGKSLTDVIELKKR